MLNGRAAWPPRRPQLLLEIGRTSPPIVSGKLRSRLRGKTELTESNVLVGEKTYRVFHPVAADALIDESEFDLDERLPYWAELWPSALALARYVAEKPLSGKRIVELGCGVGLPTVVALDRGAEVLATDHYEAALDFVTHNALVNTGHEPLTMLLDWHSTPADNPGRFDVVMAADVLYEQRNVPSLVKFIPNLLTPEGEVLIADPRRKDTPNFLEEMQTAGFQHMAESLYVEQGGREIKVLLHRMRRT